MIYMRDPGLLREKRSRVFFTIIKYNPAAVVLGLCKNGAKAEAIFYIRCFYWDMKRLLQEPKNIMLEKCYIC